MKNRILKEIRYFEDKPDNYQGEFDGMIGSIYQGTTDMKFIGQRIARKLNEFEFISGEFDHIYLQLTADLKIGDFFESDEFLDNRIKIYNCGVNPVDFNKSTDAEKDLLIIHFTFSVLKLIYKDEFDKILAIEEVKRLIEIDRKELTINYKSKETNKFRIDLNYQIRPVNDKSLLIIDFYNKENDTKVNKILEILDYEDLYSLIDNFKLETGFLKFIPKKSWRAEIVNKKYFNSLNGIKI